MAKRKVGHPQPAIMMDGPDFILLDQRSGIIVRRGGTSESLKRYAGSAWPDYRFRWTDNHDNTSSVATPTHVTLELE